MIKKLKSSIETCFSPIISFFLSFLLFTCFYMKLQYGEDRIIQLVTSLSASSSRDIIEALKADTDRFRDGAEQNDDLTMLAFRVTQAR